MDELQVAETAFRRTRQLAEAKREHFFDWIQDTVEAEEKAELNQRIRDLESENESLREFSGQEDAEPEDDSREEFERDLILADAAEVVRDMLVEDETEHQSAVEEDQCE
jgi:plasmid stabilization system protein ParE